MHCGVHADARERAHAGETPSSMAAASRLALGSGLAGFGAGLDIWLRGNEAETAPPRPPSLLAHARPALFGRI
eukprot:2549600-Pleurochrysis_carterae.AAC.2